MQQFTLQLRADDHVVESVSYHQMKMFPNEDHVQFQLNDDFLRTIAACFAEHPDDRQVRILFCPGGGEEEREVMSMSLETARGLIM